MTEHADSTASSPTKWGDREQRRADILAAGESLLTNGGYHALRMRDVATQARISPGAIYTYYSNKESLFIAVFADRLQRMLTALEPAVSNASNPVEAFITTTNMYRDSYLTFGREFDALSLVADRQDVQPEVAAQLRDATARIVTTLSATLEKFGYQGDTAQAMTFLWSTMTGLTNHYATERQQFLTVTWDDAVRFASERLAQSLGLNSTGKF